MEALLNFLFGWTEWLQCAVVIDQYERGVLLRFGKYKKTLGPGFHWIVPAGVDEVLTTNVVPTTTNLDTQIVTTSDWETVLLGAVVRWRVEDVMKMTLNLEDADDVLFDTAYGMVAKVAQQRELEELDSEEFRGEVLKQIRRRVGRYGLHVEDVFITDMAKAKAFKLT